MEELNRIAEERTEKIFTAMRTHVALRTDSLFSYLMLGQWLFAIGCAVVLTPKSYSGSVSTLHPHVWAALILGGLLTFLPCSFVILRPGEVITRHVIAVTQMMMSALLIHLTGGRVETHFHIFGSLAFLAFYRDWKVIMTAATVAALDHLLRGIYWPMSVFGTANVSHWEWMEHTGWVLFEVAFLVPGCLNTLKAMRELSARQVQLEMMNEQVEKNVKERTEELEVTQRQLMQSQKLEAIGQLASGVAHDFNNMLGGILAYSSLLKEDYAKDEHLVSSLSVIESSAERGAELTKKLLAFARKGNYEHTIVDLEKTVAETVALLEPSLNEKVSVAIKIDRNLWPTEGDSTQIFQVVMNLAVNAKDAMPAGGRILITATNVDADLDYCNLHRSVTPGSYVRLSIEDNGCGIPKEIQEKVFEPFFTTKQAGSGTGLGLSMVYGIMKNHKGAVGLYSEPGHGTVFHLYFPRSKKVYYQEAPVSGMSIPSRTSLLGQEILLADDEETMRRAGSDILSRYGASVNACENGELALTELCANPGKYKIIILDAIMPKMNGIEAFHRMREVAPDAQFIFSSGYAESAEITELRNRYSVKFIQKPFKAEHLAREVLKKVA
ncbi:hybrid sensor histidine kinase/response regulator [Bdellovibrio sp. GT3]|uniref:hybrid sensor histidine kinase/response regulator n=1 Tax=Bdellovibrio sp. GT3 TaxID=3136282 RepID=UPI0030F08FCA